MILPERLEASQREEEGRAVPPDELDAAELVCDSGDGSGDDGLAGRDQAIMNLSRHRGVH